MRSGQIIDLCHTIVKPYYAQRSAQAISLVRNAMNDLPVRIHVSEGAIFLWLWFEGLPITSDQLYQNLKAKDVFVISGHHFFPGLDDSWNHQHECIRISYAGNIDQLEAGIEIIAETVRAAYHEPESI